MWSAVSLEELYNTHPNWVDWVPETQEPYVLSVQAKLKENKHSDLQKCTVDPMEARSLSDAQGIPPETGFWLIPPRRAVNDVRLFNCTERCNEAGTAIMIPEHKHGYPAARGSTVLVKSGVAYGIGVLYTDIFDQHIAEGRPCCSKMVVVLRSTRTIPSEDPYAPSAAMAELVGHTTKDNSEKRPLGPAALMKMMKQFGLGGSRKSLDNAMPKKKSAPAATSASSSLRNSTTNRNTAPKVSHTWLKSSNNKSSSEVARDIETRKIDVVSMGHDYGQ
ncbi:hypothetical protein HDU76_003594 [Blyttiomyces sp. JEL0837]|nr:hypothetical protein HDU76_003594 [Blyttiomyces sp. JEL0837]